MLTRSTAFKVAVRDVVEGEFVRTEDKWESNYVVTSSKERVSRLRILASVVSKFEGENGNYIFVVLDDGTDTIAVKAFGEEMDMLQEIQLGDIVDVVGKVKEYQGEHYVNPEYVRKIEDPNWELVRKLELLLAKGAERKADSITAPSRGMEEQGEVKEEVVSEGAVAQAEGGEVEVRTGELPEKVNGEKEGGNGDKPAILRLIGKLDEGDGVKYVTLLKESKLDEEPLEAILTELMQDGDIYEPKIGRFKKV